MSSVFSLVVGLLTAALSLLGFVQQHPELPQASRDQAQQIAQQAITQATQALSNAPSTALTQPSQQTVTQTNAGSLSVSTTNGQTPLTVTFSIQQSAGGQFIDFGDGTNPCSPMTLGFTMTETGCEAPAYPQTFTHTYASAGVYAVTASRLLPASTLGSATITVTGNDNSVTQPSTAITPLSASPNSGPAPLTVLFLAPPNASIDFGDGKIATHSNNADATYDNWSCDAAGPSTKCKIKHMYASAGVYSAVLFNRPNCLPSSGGSPAPSCDGVVLGRIQVTVENQSGTIPTYSFVTSPTSGSAPLTVNFTYSDPAPGQYYVARFHDGSNSDSLVVPNGGVYMAQHTFKLPGTYTVTLEKTTSATVDASGPVVSSATITVQ